MARTLSMKDAVNEALDQEMERDPTVLMMGEDIVGGAGAAGEVQREVLIGQLKVGQREVGVAQQHPLQRRPGDEQGDREPGYASDEARAPEHVGDQGHQHEAHGVQLLIDLRASELGDEGEASTLQRQAHRHGDQEDVEEAISPKEPRPGPPGGHPLRERRQERLGVRLAQGELPGRIGQRLAARPRRLHRLSALSSWLRGPTAASPGVGWIRPGLRWTPRLFRRRVACSPCW